jgi:hypothetical protein
MWTKTKLPLTSEKDEKMALPYDGCAHKNERYIFFQIYGCAAWFYSLLVY